MNIQENIPLAPLTTFKLGGSARYFVLINEVVELKEAFDFAHNRNLPILVLAGGSNIIFSSTGFPGLVMKVNIGGITVTDTKIEAGAAVMMSELVDRAITQDLSGLEWAGGLPGTFGGAIRGNAGCFGAEIKDIIESVTAFDLTSGEQKTYSNQECRFVYRGSIFKDDRKLVIVSASVKLRPGNQEELRKIADSRIAYRQTNHPMEYGSAGSIFKNTPVAGLPQEVVTEFKDVIKTDPFPVIPTAAIIARAGIKGLKVGQAQISEKHTNYIVNLGNATGEDVVQLIEQVKKVILEKYRIKLEIEPELVGFK